MEKPSEAIRELAEQLFAAETAARDSTGNNGAFSVCEKLRSSLVRFAGADAFSALMRRSLALSRADIPALESVTLDPSGCVGELDLIAADNGKDSGIVITTNLLWLLVTFLGEPVAMRLVKDAWPDLRFEK